ncbi:MAG: hypothetical protein GC200_10020 [Tepidisphaera sp.]|nr:hypothetical protein [Tepidisphaera sp.]
MERMQASLLRRTPAWYRARLRLALNLLRFGILGFGAAPFVYFVTGEKLPAMVGYDAFVTAMWVYLALSLVVFSSGLFLMATPVLPFVNYAIAESARKWLRSALAGGWVLIAGGVACVVLSPLLRSSTYNPEGLGFVLAALGVLMILLSAIMSIDYSVWLAACVPDPSLVRQGKTFLWLAPLLSILGLCFIALGPLAAGILVFIFLTKLRRRVMAPDLEAA